MSRKMLSRACGDTSEWWISWQLISYTQTPFNVILRTQNDRGCMGTTSKTNLMDSRKAKLVHSLVDKKAWSYCKAMYSGNLAGASIVQWVDKTVTVRTIRGCKDNDSDKPYRLRNLTPKPLVHTNPLTIDMQETIFWMRLKVTQMMLLNIAGRCIVSACVFVSCR